VFVTNLADPPEEIGRDYNQRACLEQRIEELKADWAADDFCLREFFATEVAFLGILMLFNLRGECQRATGMTAYRQPASLRVGGSCAERSWAARAINRCSICPPPGEDSKSATRCLTSF